MYIYISDGDLRDIFAASRRNTHTSDGPLQLANAAQRPIRRRVYHFESRARVGSRVLRHRLRRLFTRNGGLLYNIFINFFFFFGVLLFRFLSFSRPITVAARPICMYVFRNYYSSSSRRHRRPPPLRANYQVNIRARYKLTQTLQRAVA